MKIRKAFKFRLKTRAHHHNKLSQFSGCQRFVWNAFLAMQKDRLERSERIMSYVDMAKELIGLKYKSETSFLKDVHSQTLQQTLKSLDRALKDGLRKKKGFPKFRRKGRSESFKYPQGIKLEGGSIFLPKIGWIKLFLSQTVEGKICQVTVSKSGDHWFVSIQVEIDIEKPAHSSISAVGIDLGVKRFATLSNGEYYLPLNSFKKLEKMLVKEQRKLSRKQKFSNNWKRQKRRVQKIHTKIANARKDYLNKISSNICKNHALVVLEELDISQMSKRQSLDTRKKSQALNRSILDQGWYEFRRQVAYKQEWLGGQMMLVDPKNTSRTCPKCRFVSKENRKTQSAFCCQSCLYQGHADEVAAVNILMAVGHTVSACGETKAA